MYGCQIVFALVCKLQFTLPGRNRVQTPNTSLGGSRQRVLQIITFETLGAIKLYWNISVCFAKVGTFEGNNPLSPNRAEILFNGLSGQCGFTHQEIVMFTIANIIQLRLFGKYMA